jgi:hypothetical protein
MTSLCISTSEELSQVNMIRTHTIEELTNKLVCDIKKGNDYTWIDNRFLTSTMYYDIVNQLSPKMKRCFDNLNKSTPVRVSSQISFDEIKYMFENDILQEECDLQQIDEEEFEFDS